ncbi:MAG: radical SAM protein [Calditrichaeota bacterium]|nr:MAG: radical SAM protein [Calditrichota bacterium]
MSDVLPLYAPRWQPATIAMDPQCAHIRKNHFDNKITFYAPGLKSYKTSEYSCHSVQEFVSISVTGENCALSCEHCKTKSLHGMLDVRGFEGGLFGMCAQLAQKGTRGVLISGGSDIHGRVPLLKHIPDMIRVRRELGLAIRVHPGLPDEQTCAALAEVGLDGVMLDIIGDQETITEIYHLKKTPADYEAVLERMHRYKLPAIPHIILGHYFGEMRGEWAALDMIKKYPPKTLVLVILMPLQGTGMVVEKLPTLDEIGRFFDLARRSLPRTPIILGCARPMGPIKLEIDKLAIDAGLNGVAYPADGMVSYAKEQGLEPDFINACCGVSWT